MMKEPILRIFLCTIFVLIKDVKCAFIPGLCNNGYTGAFNQETSSIFSVKICMNLKTKLAMCPSGMSADAEEDVERVNKPFPFSFKEENEADRRMFPQIDYSMSPNETYQYLMDILRPPLPTSPEQETDIDNLQHCPPPKVTCFNNAGASPSPPSVIRTMMAHFALEMTRGGYHASHLVKGKTDLIYKYIGRLIHSQDCNLEDLENGEEKESYTNKKWQLSNGNNKYRREIALVESATVGWTRVFYSMAEYKAMQVFWEEDEAIKNTKSDDKKEIQQLPSEPAIPSMPALKTLRTPGKRNRYILISEAEYAANVVAIVKFCRDQNLRNTNVRWSILSIPSTYELNLDCKESSSGMVDLNAFDSMLSGTWLLDNDSSSKENNDDSRNRENDVNHDKKVKYLNPKDIVMVCITHIPTNSGIVNPVYEIGERIAKFNEKQHRRWKRRLQSHCNKISDDHYDSSSNSNILSSISDVSGNGLPSILYLVDACQSAGQLSLDVQEMHCHALTATGRKYLRGPRGTGFLYVRYDIANVLPPSHIDHAAAPVVFVPDISVRQKERGESGDVSIKRGSGGGLEDKLHFGYSDGASRFEFWESSLASQLGLGEAVRYALEEVGIENIESRCLELARELRVRLRLMDGIAVHHDIGEGYDKASYTSTVATDRPGRRYGNDTSEARRLSRGRKATVCGIVTFTVHGSSAASVKETMMTRGGFEVSVVPATSTPVDSSNTMVGDSDLVRVSLSYMNTVEEIEKFCDILRSHSIH